MTSILTNLPAMSASQKLRDINYNLEVVQNRVSSGLRVSDAADNAAYWSIAQVMKSDKSALSAVSDAIGLGSAKVDIAKAGISEAIKVISGIKEKLVAAIERGTDSKSIQSEITQLQEQLRDIAKGASFNGENWLRTELGSSTASIPKSVVSSFIRDNNGEVKVTTMDYALDQDTVLFDISNSSEHYGLLDRNHKVKINKQELKETKVSFYNKNNEIVNKKMKLVTTDGVWLKAAGAIFDQERGIAQLKQNENGNAQTGASSKSPSAPVSTGDKTYLRIGNSDTWVVATNNESFSDGKSIALAKAEDGTSYYIDTNSTNVDARVLPDEVNMDYSLVTFDITKNSNNYMYNESNSIQVMLSFVDNQLKAVTSAAGKIGSISSRIHLQENFIKYMSDSIEKGVGRLVDADMAAESSRLSALQTQQQLAIQALSIVNNSTARILSLFR
ncbi:flagellin [Candidatus Liberibacter africanus]|uniref:Flagellin n=1 Tax=Candidatus Liberibacter africanus PTSAPSY TaxID=1277257 RepID=A0A0G3I519_LIBAF|nr:flagellin [Candidatus Liberibacter africanus]AKK20370.1 flagellin domain-containing protein [Candidatus Liberibacter africanus PTSAPSY]QTP64107.1 flagellin [Candidatus Liberibacter africanus]